MNSSLYAIIKSGGKQYRVEKDDIIEVELLDGELGSEVEFKEILFVCEGEEEKAKINIGKSIVSKYLVKGILLDVVRGPKIVSVKYKPRHNERKKFGHRQNYSRVKITEIQKH